MEPRSPSRTHRQLISELKQLREAIGLSGELFGEMLGWSQSKVSKIENGRTKPSVKDVEDWARASDADRELTAELIDLAESVSNESRPWSARSGSLAKRSRVIAQAEAEMTGLYNYQPAVLPGLLQTAAYARRVVSMLGVASVEDLAETVAIRMERQTILYAESKHFEFMLSEGALRWRPGPPSLLLAQLDRLISIATLPNVLVGVLPFGREAVALQTNGFTIFEVPDDPFVLVEVLTEESHLHEESHLVRYREVFAQLRDAATTGAEALELIRRIMADIATE